MANVMEREAPPINAMFWAKRSFGYGGLELDRGQVARLKGLPNDRLLVDLGYLVIIRDEKASRFPCRVCGAEFIEQAMRDGHGKTRHEQKAFVPPAPPQRESGEHIDAYKNRLDEWSKRAGAMADAQGESKAKREDEVAPLDLTKTTASRT